MKNLLLLLFLVPAFAMVSQDMNINSISKAIENGDAKALSQYFDANVDIAILDKEDTYNKTNAETLLADFFAKNKPSSYTQVHAGVSKKENSQYSIGNMKAASGMYRVYLYLKVEGTKYTIQEIRIDKE